MALLSAPQESSEERHRDRSGTMRGTTEVRDDSKAKSFLSQGPKTPSLWKPLGHIPKFVEIQEAIGSSPWTLAGQRRCGTERGTEEPN